MATQQFSILLFPRTQWTLSWWTFLLFSWWEYTESPKLFTWCPSSSTFFFKCISVCPLGFRCGSAGKESTCNAGDLGSIPGLGRSPGEGKGYPLQYSGLENSMDCRKESDTTKRLSLSSISFTFVKRKHTINTVFHSAFPLIYAAVHSLSLVPFLPPSLIPFYNSMIFYFLKAIWFFPASLPTKEHLGVSCSLLLSPIIIVSPSLSLCSL